MLHVLFNYEHKFINGNQRSDSLKLRRTHGNQPVTVHSNDDLILLTWKLWHEKNIQYTLMSQMVQENKKLKRQSQLLISQVGGQVNFVCAFFVYICFFFYKVNPQFKL